MQGGEETLEEVCHAAKTTDKCCTSSAGCQLRRIFKCIWFQRKPTNLDQTMRSILELNLKFRRKQSCREFKEPQFLFWKLCPILDTFGNIQLGTLGIKIDTEF